MRIEAHDRPGLERLLRYCARPAFALERLREIDPEHRVYHSVKPDPGGGVSLMLTPLELTITKPWYVPYLVMRGFMEWLFLSLRA